jgi:hypothetical protein
LESTFTYQDLSALLNSSAQPAVSIYLPVHRKGTEIQQDPIRFKNLLKEARQQLEMQEFKGNDADALLAPAAELLDDFSFWQNQLDGLAVFVAPGELTVHKLPYPVDAQVHVGEYYTVRPLIPRMTQDGEFFLLALSQNQVRLYQGTRTELSEIELVDVPTSLPEALRFDDPEAFLQWHTGTSGSRGKRSAMFFGQGGLEQDENKNIRRFFNQLRDGVAEALGDSTSPLLLAGVEYLLPIYRQANSYPHLLEPTIPGNPEEKSLDELHEQAWDFIAPIFKHEKLTALEHYKNQTSTGLATSQAAEIIPAAVAGRVDVLFVRQNGHLWGTYDAISHAVELDDTRQPGDEDLLELAAQQTLVQKGRVFLVSPDLLPENSQAAAIFRYTIGQEV